MNHTIFTYGLPGAGKTHFASTFPKPLLHLCFDPAGKARPMHKGQITQIPDVGYGVPGIASESGVMTELWGAVYNKRRFVLDLKERLRKLNENFTTVVFDSCTSFGYQCRTHNEMFARNSKGEKLQDPRKHYGFAKETFEHLFYITLPNLPVKYVIVLAHMQQTKTQEGDFENKKANIDGQLLYVPSLPGTLPLEFGHVFSEIWRLYTKGAKTITRLLQTQPDGFYLANTMSGVPTGKNAAYGEISAFLEGGI